VATTVVAGYKRQEHPEMYSFKIHSGFLLLLNIRISYSQTYTTPVQHIGSCPKLTDNDDILGRKDGFSREGLLPSLFVSGDGERPPSLKITRYKILCEAPGYTRFTASMYSLIVEYEILHSRDKMQVVEKSCRYTVEKRILVTFDTPTETNCFECIFVDSKFFIRVTGCGDERL